MTKVALFNPPSVIADGSMVFLYISPRLMHPVTLRSGGKFNNRMGCFYHDDMIGLPYGSRVSPRRSDGTSIGDKIIHLLQPTPELWTIFLPHRTQIIYTPDISVIVSMLDLKPGSRVIESGTGSGSLSHSLCRTIAPRGHLYTFEFHPQRAQIARDEFEAHGMSDWITVINRDVCEDGFDDDQLRINHSIDAVFLDLPEPWRAVPHIVDLFKSDEVGRVCCFSPCWEQVIKACDSLRLHGFDDVKMVECLHKPLETKRHFIGDLEAALAGRKLDPLKEVHVTKCPQWEIKGHTAYLIFASYLPQYEVAVAFVGSVTGTFTLGRRNASQFTEHGHLDKHHPPKDEPGF